MDVEKMKERQATIDKMKRDIYEAALACKLPGNEMFRRMYNDLYDDVIKLKPTDDRFDSDMIIFNSRVKQFISTCEKLDAFYTSREERREKAFASVRDLIKGVEELKNPLPDYVDDVKRYREIGESIVNDYINLLELRNIDNEEFITRQVIRLEVACEMYVREYGERIGLLIKIHEPYDILNKDVQEEENESDEKRTK